MRPNFAQDAPPTEISVGGSAYKIETDYRIWIDVQKELRKINLNTTDPDVMDQNEVILENIERMVFGGVLADENAIDVLKGIYEFLGGYPSLPIEGSGDAPVFSFEYDLNMIILAIRNQSGIDLSYRRKEPFHWWEFLLEFQSLAGDHHILHIMETRGYKGNDKDMLRLKRIHSLPVEYTAEEQAQIDAFDALFQPKGDKNEDD